MIYYEHVLCFPYDMTAAHQIFYGTKYFELVDQQSSWF